MHEGGRALIARVNCAFTSCVRSLLISPGLKELVASARETNSPTFVYVTMKLRWQGERERERKKGGNAKVVQMNLKRYSCGSKENFLNS